MSGDEGELLRTMSRMQTRLSDVVKNQLAPCPAVPSLFELVDE